MKLTIYDNDLAYGGLMIDAQGFIRDRIFLSAEGNAGLSAVTKSYVDTKALNLSASALVTDYVPAGNAPFYTGAVTFEHDDGYAQYYNLPTNGVTPGWYTKFVLDDYGRVSQGLFLEASDIPSAGWSDVSEKPTTAAGFGVTDGLLTSGGTLGGPITVAADPVTPDEVATKGYVDTTLSGGPAVEGLPIGSIVLTDTWDSAKFIQCNGGVLPIDGYGGIFRPLYDVIGHAYRNAATQGHGQPWKQQYSFNSEQTEIAAPFYAIPNSTISSAEGQRALIRNNAVIRFGGKLNTTYYTTCSSMSIREDGSFGIQVGVSTGALPASRAYGQVLSVGGYIYYIGGETVGGVASNVIWRTSWGTNNTFGSWSTVASSLPTAETGHCAFVIGKKLHVIGFGTSYVIDLAGGGLMTGSWSSSLGGATPEAVRHSDYAIIGNRVYLFGGLLGDGAGTNKIFSAPINLDGTLGAWVTEAQTLPVAMGKAQVVVVKNRVYFIGGTNGTTYSSATVSAPILEDGTIGTWAIDGYSTSSEMAGHQAFVIKDLLVYLGGRGIAGYPTAIYATAFRGGLNDYTNFSTQQINAAGTATEYNLPNLDDVRVDGMQYYIKYA
ncbi:MAG: kelch repeat-containing protein [Candidatus Nanopelagicales bacterium]|nr:kelch repeat-containing protein [Candidatus Nanopelagicales bacterium]